MKRLLVYLFIVLGLGLILNINANAAKTKKIDYLCISQNKDNKKEYVKHKDDEYLLQVFYKNKLLNLKKNKNCAYKVFSTDPIFQPLFDTLSDKNVGKKILADGSWGLTKTIKKKIFLKEYENLKTTKKEPSQTQKVANDEVIYISIDEAYKKNLNVCIPYINNSHWFHEDYYTNGKCKKNEKTYKISNERGYVHSDTGTFLYTAQTNIFIDQKGDQKIQIAEKEPSQKRSKKLNNLKRIKDSYYEIYLVEKNKTRIKLLDRTGREHIGKGVSMSIADNQCKTLNSKNIAVSLSYEKDLINNGIIREYKCHSTGTQIAKAEPSQTLKKTKKKENKQIVYKQTSFTDDFIKIKSRIYRCLTIPLGLPYNEDLNVRVKLKLAPNGKVLKTELVDHDRINKKGQAYYKVLAESILRAIKMCQPLNVPKNGYSAWKVVELNFNINKLLEGGDNSLEKEILGEQMIEIAKTEPTVKPKKKKKVVQQTKEEFEPEKKDLDNDAPIIEIAEVITVNDTDYEFQGKVTDQAKTIYIEIDGRPTDVKNGKFIVKGYSPIDKQISIEAIDQWGNRSEPKIVKLKIDIKDTIVAEKLEPLNPSKIRSKSSNNKVALIIGIENYLESPSAKYANLDAKYFFDYARKGFGVKKQNINLLVDEEATFVKTNKALTKWLRSKIKADQSDLIIFFAGHGLASSDGKELYLLPQDSDPDLLSRTALSRTELFQEIINLNPKSVTMFLDTCYSGVSRDEQMLLASARPIRIIANDEEGIPNNFTIFSASQIDQISSGLKEAKHGIFSYYLMKGLEGKADRNNDKNITNGELLAYMDENVSQKAAEQGREQNPSLAGDPDKVLISYR